MLPMSISANSMSLWTSDEIRSGEEMKSGKSRESMPSLLTAVLLVPATFGVVVVVVMSINWLSK